jgi:hypothetical protein
VNIAISFSGISLMWIFLDKFIHWDFPYYSRQMATLS